MPVVPVIAKCDTAPPLLSDVIRCQCRVHDKKCSTVVCSCHKERLSCTSYCNCAGNQGCCNPYTNRESVVAVDEENVDGGGGCTGRICRGEC